jgi:hypothetical protein
LHFPFSQRSNIDFPSGFIYSFFFSFCFSNAAQQKQNMPRSESKKRSGLSAIEAQLDKYQSDAWGHLDTVGSNINKIKTLLGEGGRLQDADQKTLDDMVKLLDDIENNRLCVIPNRYQPKEYAKQTTRMLKYLQAQSRKREEDARASTKE